MMKQSSENRSASPIEQEYEVEFIFGKLRHRIDKDVRYAVKWEGFSKDQMSWEPLENFVNQSEMCVRRFERCLSYQQYYTQKKRTSTNGIRIHILGPFAQVYVPEILFMKPRPDSEKNRDAKPIIKKIEERKLVTDPSPLKENFKQTIPSIDQPVKQLNNQKPQNTQITVNNQKPEVPQANTNNQKPQNTLISANSQQMRMNNTQNEAKVKVQPVEQQQVKELAPTTQSNMNKSKDPIIVESKLEETDETKQESSKFLGKFNKKSANIQKIEQASSSTQVKQSTKLNDAEMLQGKEKESILPKIYQEQLRQHLPTSQIQQPTLPPSNKYKLLQQQQPLDNMGQPTPKERPKIKTERDYLNEIINAQRIKEQQQKTSVNQSMNQGPNSQYFQTKMAQQGDSSFNVKLSMEGENESNGVGKLKMQDNSRSEQQSSQQLQTSYAVGIQCLIEPLRLEDNLYKIEKKGARFLQLGSYESQGLQFINCIINHSLAQINNDKSIKLVFQVRLSELNQIAFTTMDYLQEKETIMLIDYCIGNALFH